MKNGKIILAIFLVLCTSWVSALAIDLQHEDYLLGQGLPYGELLGRLEDALNTTSNRKEKSEICWRMSRIAMLAGDELDKKDKEGRRQWFDKGADYAMLGLEYDPQQYRNYMWHSANIGRRGQTGSIFDQAATVKPILADVSAIIDKLGILDYSEPWQTLAEVYYQHPAKSTDQAVSFARMALATVPEGEVRLPTYLLLAEILRKRGWTVTERTQNLQEMKKEFESAHKTNIEKYAYYEGSPEVEIDTAITDRQEAKQLLIEAKKLYMKANNRASANEQALVQIEKYLNKWK